MFQRFDQKQRLTLAVIFVLFCWATAFSGIKIALESFSPTHLAFLRFFISSIALGMIGFFRGMRKPTMREIPWLMVTGLIGVSLYHIALNYGQQTVSPGTASFIINCSPIFTAILATIFLRENLSIQAWSGIFISFIGVSIISVGKEGGIAFEPGAILILLSAISISVYAVVQKSKLSRLNGFEYAAYSVWIGTLGLFFFSNGFLEDLANSTWNARAAILYLGVFPGALSYIAWGYCITKLPASKVVSFMYFIPVLAVLTAFILFKELPSGYAILGGAFAFGGVYILHSSKQKNQVLAPE